MGASLSSRIKACFSVMETTQSTFSQKVNGHALSWGGYAYHVWDSQGVLLAYSQTHGENENFASYCSSVEASG
jgi:hypothetical protein